MSNLVHFYVDKVNICIYSTIFDPDTDNKMEVVYCYTLAQLTIIYTYDDTERNRAPYVHVLFNKLTCVFVNPLLPHG